MSEDGAIAGVRRAAAALCAALALLPGAAGAEERLDRVTLQLKWLHQFQFAGYYAAQARGFYRQAGLEVEIREGSLARSPTEEVAKGGAEFGVHAGADLLYQRLRGAPLVALATVFQHSPAVVVTRRADRIHRPADLVGRTLMLTLDQGEANILAMFRREGIDVDGDPARSVRILPHSWNPADLATGKVDGISAYLTTEPLALQRAGVEVDLLRPVAYGIDFYGDTLFTREELLESSPDLVQRFTRASMQGWTYAMAHPEEVAELILRLESARRPGPDRDALLAEARAMDDLVLPRLVEMGHMNLGRWERMAEELRLLGLVEDGERVAGIVPRTREGQLLRTLLLAIGAAVALAAVALLWARQLRREVQLRTADLQREVALRAAQSEELEASLRTNRAILSGIPDLIFVNRRDGTYLEYHARAQGDLALPPEAFLGRTPGELFPPEFAARMLASYAAAIDQDRMQLLEYPLEIAGRRRFFEARVVRLGADTVLTIVRDVTGRVEMEAHLDHAQRLEAIGTLAGGIAHDFNNVLAAIVGNAELGLASAGPSGEVAEDLRSILQASERGAALVKQILAFSRPRPGQSQLVELATLLQESQRFLRATLPAAIELSADIRSRARIEADPGELQRVVLNLSTNAALAMQGTQGRLTLRLEDRVLDEGECRRHPGLAPGPHVQLTVADTGCGMTAEVRARIFEPFFTTRGAGEGTGLGLSIVHGVIKRLEGAIEVESEPGRGSAFRILLPVSTPRAAGQGASAAGPERGEGRLLVVDDEPALAQLLERNLTRLGYSVRAFTSGQEALQALEAAPSGVDALVTDLAMPHLSGEELTRRARAVRADLPVLLCTGNRHELSDERAAALGIAQVLEKPVDAARLSAALRQALAGRVAAT